MIKKILAYGDSFTAGHGVREDQAWPVVLSKMLGVPVDNRGVRGGSNKLSIINLMNDIDGVSDLENTLIAFSWTAVARTCFYDYDWQNVLPNFEDHRENVKTFSKNYYGHVYSDYDALTEYYLQQIMVSSFLKEKKVKYFFVNSLKDVDMNSLPATERSETYILQHKSLVSLLDKDKFVLGYDHSIFYDFCVELSMRADDGFHPSPDAHAMVAARMFWFLFDKKII